jgi:hypothetical protein
VISAEWVQTVATGIPVYAGAGLLLWGQGWVWRRALWEEHAPVLREIALALDGPITPVWTGWRVRGARGDFRLAGGLQGTRARLTGSQQREWAGMPDIAEIRALL